MDLKTLGGGTLQIWEAVKKLPKTVWSSWREADKFRAASLNVHLASGELVAGVAKCIVQRD